VSGAIISNGGDQIDGGIASGTLVSAGGAAFIQNGGVAFGMKVGGAAASDVIQAGGIGSGTLVSSGGSEVVFSGGSAVSTSAFGGVDQVLAGGVATSALVAGGGFIIISSGGTINGATLGGLRGGTLQLHSGGLTGSAAIGFSVAGLLELDDSVHFSGTLATFTAGNQLDLKDIGFTSATTLSFTESPGNSSGTLQVSDGAHTANILLLGQYMTGNFQKNTDGAGGTLITTTVTSSSDIGAGLVNPNG
jgi:autotransporter passenger strand-loop-strand repeat protein